MGQHFHMYDMAAEEDFILRPGRLATGAGLTGLLFGVILTVLTIFDGFTIVVIPILFGYISLAGCWGAYELNQWFRKYRYRMHNTLWHVLRVFVIILGIIIGVTGWGLLEHFTLLLAIDAKGGIIGSQLVLLPIIGRKFSKILRRPSLIEETNSTYPPYQY